MTNVKISLEKRFYVEPNHLAMIPHIRILQEANESLTRSLRDLRKIRKKKGKAHLN